MFAGLFGLSTYVISQFNKHPEKYRRGTVTRLNQSKGYGTISPDDKRSEVRVYFHKSHPLAEDLRIGDRVGFQSHFGKRHRPRAINVVVFKPKIGKDGKETVKVKALPTREPNPGEESDLSRASSSANSERMSTCSLASVSSLSSAPRARRHTLQSEGRQPSRSPRPRHDSLMHYPEDRRSSHSHRSLRRDSVTADHEAEPRVSSQSDRYSYSHSPPERFLYSHSPPSDRYQPRRQNTYDSDRYVMRYC